MSIGGGQVGSPGAHNGIGSVAVADWWLVNGLAVEEETDAAATPAKAIESAKMRMASLMMSNLFVVISSGKQFPVTPCLYNRP